MHTCNCLPQDATRIWDHEIQTTDRRTAQTTVGPPRTEQSIFRTLRDRAGNRAAYVKREIAIRCDMAKELTQRTTVIIKMSTD